MSKADQTRLPECIRGLRAEDILKDKDSKTNAPILQTLLGLFYLGCGGMDEAHELATEDSHLPAPFQAHTTYLHAIVHRAEGQNVGEFGSGWSNANYWFTKLGTHPVFERVLKEVVSMEPQSYLNITTWDPKKFTRLCSEAVSTKNEKQITFCQTVINTEWRLLFEHCLQLVV